MKDKTLDEAVSDLNAEVNKFISGTDKLLARIEKIEEEKTELERDNERLTKELKNSHEAYEMCVEVRKGWREMYENKDKEHDELWEKYMKLMRSK